MNRTVTVGLGMLVAGAALGAAAVQTLYAQAKPPAFQIVEVTVNDQDGFSKEFVPVISKVQQEVGGKFLARGGKTVSYQGAPPAPRIVLIQYDNMEKLQAALDSTAMKSAIAVGRASRNGWRKMENHSLREWHAECFLHAPSTEKRDRRRNHNKIGGSELVLGTPHQPRRNERSHPAYHSKTSIVAQPHRCTPNPRRRRFNHHRRLCSAKQTENHTKAHL